MSLEVAVILPTTCETRRAETLLRAVESALSQRGVAVELIAVVNGKRFDGALCDKLSATSGVRLIYESRASLPHAIAIGRRAVRQPVFTFLDDDDEYLPETLFLRADALASNPDVDAVVVNGYRLDKAGVESLAHADLAAVGRDPLAALLDVNWLASCGCAFRTVTIPADWFDVRSEYVEWTALAFRLAVSARLRFIDVPGYRVHHTPGSRSQSPHSLEATLRMLRILRSELPSPTHRILGTKIGRALHDLADTYWRSGEPAKAWAAHVRSLLQPGGARYLGFTRRLIATRGSSGH